MFHLMVMIFSFEETKYFLKAKDTIIFKEPTDLGSSYDDHDIVKELKKQLK